MIRTAAAVLALVVLSVVIALATRDPDILTEPLTVAVPTAPDDPSTLDLDALLYLPADTPAPAVLMAHGFGSDRTALDGVARRYAAEGYVVLTWSARGFGASEGVITLGDPDREVADVSTLVDVLAGRPEVLAEGADPLVAVVGGSYGGGLALLAAAQEPRLDAVVAAAAWHSLARSLSPNRAGTDDPGVLKEQWASILFTTATIGSLVGDGDLEGLLDGTTTVDLTDPVQAACGRFDTDVCLAYARTATRGILSPEDAAVLDASSLAGRLDDITAPTMLIAGLDDTLFGLDESLTNAEGITAPLALRWVPGDHGAAASVDRDEALDWLDRHLRADSGPAEASPALLEWTDPVAGRPQPADALPGQVAGTTVQTLALATGGRLTDQGGTGVTAVVAHPPGGLPASLSTLPGLGPLGGLLPDVDLPGQSVSFTTEALSADLTLLGRPTLTLDVDAPIGTALLYVKLYDVTPGGTTTLLQSAVNPVRLGDVPASVTVQLEPVARRLVAGNRLRLTVATTDQAFADGRAPAVITLGGDATLALPVTPLVLGSSLPAAVRIAVPLLVVLLGAVIASVLTRRHERRLGGPGPAGDDPAGDDPAGPTADAAVVIRGLVKAYDDGKVAVDGLDLTVGRGQVFGLLGPNGAGKTTTLRMLLGLIHPTEGEVRLLGQPMRPGHPVLARVGVLVEGPGFAPYLTGRQNLLSYWRAGGRPIEEADLTRALAVADLGTAIDRPTRTYSHGMRQRLAIAQALLGRPELLVLDEPTDGLDPEQIRAMRQLLARLGQEGLTILVSSHLLAEVEQMCTHAAVVQQGRVLAAGPVAELMGATRSMVVQTPDRDTAREVLHALLGPEQIDVEGSGLVVELDGTDPADVIAALVGAGVRVSAATPRGRLEDTFLALTGGEPADGSRDEADRITSGARR